MYSHTVYQHHSCTATGYKNALNFNGIVSSLSMQYRTDFSQCLVALHACTLELALIMETRTVMSYSMVGELSKVIPLYATFYCIQAPGKHFEELKVRKYVEACTTSVNRLNNLIAVLQYAISAVYTFIIQQVPGDLFT